MMDVGGARGLFPGTERRVYLDISVRSLLCTRVRSAVEEYLDLRMYEGGDKSHLHEIVAVARRRFASLVGAGDDEVAVVKNVSEALNAFATAVPWAAGDNVVLCPALEHPNNVFLWHNLRRQRGIGVRSVESPDGATVPVDRLVDAMDDRTRLVTVPAISFSPGFVTDVRSLADEARRRGVLTLVDAAQSVGASAATVADLGVDALAVATQKSLLAFYGTGFLFCRRDVAHALRPVYLARYGVAAEEGVHETALGPEEFTYASGARRFDLGNYNYLGAAAAGEALSLIREVGIDRIEAHVRGLAARLAAGLLGLGLPVVGGEPGPHLAHIVSVGRSGEGRHDTADDPAMNTLYRRLSSAGVTLSIRRGVLRFSVGVFNNTDDVDQVIEIARA